MADALPEKIVQQISKAGLPVHGTVPYVPAIETNRAGNAIIKKEAVTQGPKKGKMGYVDVSGRIWIKDRAHAGDPDHWDVQMDGGRDYIRVDLNGEMLP